jgi:hypothetical protein
MPILNLMALILLVHYYGQRRSTKETVLTALLLITNKANEEQRHALIQIVTGQAKGDSPFVVIASTFSRVLEPQFVDINSKIDGKKSSFSVPGVVNVEVESFKNLVSGEEQDTKIQLPNGFVWKLAEAAKSKTMHITTPNLNFDHTGKNAFYSVVEYKGP